MYVQRLNSWPVSLLQFIMILISRTIKQRSQRVIWLTMEITFSKTPIRCPHTSSSLWCSNLHCARLLRRIKFRLPLLKPPESPSIMKHGTIKSPLCQAQVSKWVSVHITAHRESAGKNSFLLSAWSCWITTKTVWMSSILFCHGRFCTDASQECHDTLLVIQICSCICRHDEGLRQSSRSCSVQETDQSRQGCFGHHTIDPFTNGWRKSLFQNESLWDLDVSDPQWFFLKLSTQRVSLSGLHGWHFCHWNKITFHGRLCSVIYGEGSKQV
jgi:hypothetical protein